MRVRYYNHAQRGRPEVALTFDDGPNPPRTDQVLEILEAKDVRATFFVIGKWAERFPKAVERIAAAGHVVGNHSYLHVHDIGDFDRAEAAIAAITGRPSSFLRFHYLENFAVVLQSSVAMSPEVRSSMRMSTPPITLRPTLKRLCGACSNLPIWGTAQSSTSMTARKWRTTQRV